MRNYTKSSIAKIGLFAGSGMAALSLAMTATPASAQAVPSSDSDDIAVEEGPAIIDPIVVTGSRIRRPELSSTAPVTTFSGDQIYKQSENNVGELLNDLPALRQTVSQSNPGLSIGIAGLNLLDLRGLGTRRTLVLVNGRRHVAADISSTASAVDINSIPSALIERIDVVTGGSSAVYGSDAIGGVVNFILKDDYDGIELRAGAGLPDYGAGANYFVSGLVGTNFADDRGNIAVAGEYTRQNRIFASDVPWRRRVDGFARTNVDDNGRFDGIPDSTFVRDLRTGTISRNGLVGFPQSEARDECGGSTLNGTPFNCNFVFLPNGQLVPQTFTARSSTSQFGGFIGGNGDTGNEGIQTSVFPLSERYVANLLASFEFSEAFEVFAEAKYVRAKTQGSNSGPAFAQGRFTYSDPRARARLDNPFLSEQARELVTTELVRGGVVNDLIAGGPIDLDAVADGSQRFTVNRSFEDLGSRDEDTVRETYRAVLGFRGDITSNLNYEIAGSYGRTEQDIDVLGNVFTQRLLLSLDAGRDPADGQIKCRSQFDPDAAFGQAGIDPSTLAGDIAACVPYNQFGAPDNSAARQYITADAGNFGRLEQYNVIGFLSGTTDGFFTLPGGAIGFALGAEYRREEAFFEADEAIQNNLTFTNPLPIFNPDPFEVKEAFGELEFPILADTPFFEELTFTAAGRVSEYDGAVGTTYAYNFGGRWSPIPDIAFRAQYGRAVRAPNYTETAGELTTTFITVLDPCGSNQINAGSANRAANCRADLGDILDNDAFQQTANANVSTEGRNGSNANLFEEKSDSITIGAVLQPRALPGFALTVDYYDIEVKDVIASVAGQTIINTCYDLPTLDNPFCGNFTRNGNTTGPELEVPGQILQGSILQSPLNFASRIREGIDFDLSYRTSVGVDAFVNARLLYTHVLESSNFQDPTNPDFENRLLSELGDPKDQFVFDIDFTLDQFTFGYGARYIGPQLTTLYEEQFALNDSPPQNPDRFSILEYPEIVYHDLRFAWQIEDVDSDNEFEFYVGVDNVFDEKPPLGLTGLGDGSAIYDPFGRRFYTGVRAEF
ncbi:MAG: TonB-dependent receptor [Pontixanthobacter sp.]